MKFQVGDRVLVLHSEEEGEVVDITEQGADEHIDALAKKYLGKDKYPFRQPGEVRVRGILERAICAVHLPSNFTVYLPPVVILEGIQPWARADPARARNTTRAAEKRVSFRVLVLITDLFSVLYLRLDG